MLMSDAMKQTLTLAAALGIATMAIVSAQDNWAGFGNDPGATKFSTLNQINTDNVKNLKRAWTFHTGDDSGFFESGLIVIDGVMYFSAQNGVFALDALGFSRAYIHGAAGFEIAPVQIATQVCQCQQSAGRTKGTKKPNDRVCHPYEDKPW